MVQHCMACVIANEYGVISVTKLCRSLPLAKKGMKLRSYLRMSCDKQGREVDIPYEPSNSYAT